MSESHISTLLLGMVGHGHLHSLNEFDQIDGATAALSLFRVAATTLVFGVVAKIVYNVYLHPLAKVPGPKWYAATSLPRYLFNRSGYSHTKLQELHAKYGDVVRVAPDEVSFTSAKAWSEIYGQKRIAGGGGHDFLENAKDSVFFRNLVVPSSLIMMDKESHVPARKSLGPAFSAKAVADQEHLVMGHIGTMVKLLHDAVRTSAATKSPVDIAGYINWTLFDIIGDLCFGEPFGSLKNGKEHAWVSMMPTTVKTAMLRTNVIRLLGQRLGDMTIGLFLSKDVRTNLQWHRQQVADRFERRRALGPGRPDFMSPMLEDPAFWNDQRMRGTITSLITAGSETSSTTLATAVYYLAATRAEDGDGGVAPIDTLRAELDAHFTADDQINFASVRNLPFLTAVIDETMRMHPAAVNIFPREARDGGVVVDGYYIPAKTTLGISHYAMFHSPHNFHLADTFMPQRWLGTDSRFAGDRKEAFQPFSYGPRNCIGRYLAYAEMRVILSRIVFNFDVELRPESVDWPVQKSFLIWDKGPFYVNLTHRAK